MLKQWLKMRALILCVVALMVAFGCRAAVAAPPSGPSVYVSGFSGVDNVGCGDASSPCASITYAIKLYETEKPIILISPGRYTERLEIDEDMTLIGNQAFDGAPQQSMTAETIIDADGLGTAIEITDAKVAMDWLILTGGSGFNGGGMDIRDADVTIRQCGINNNTATYGAGLYIDGDTTRVMIYDSWVSSNTGASAGGCLYSYESTVDIWDSMIVDNQVVSGSGGAIAQVDGIVGLTRCTLDGNTASENGGMAHTGHSANLNLSNCLIIDNSATAGAGDVIYGNTSNIRVTSSTVANNNPNGNQAVFIINCTFFSHNAIWWRNGDMFGGGDINTRTVEYCDVEGGWRGEGCIDESPLWALGGNYRLATGSPCIDAGTTTPAGTDLVGNDRIQDGDGDGAAVTDMGCYEKETLYRLCLPVIR